MQRKRDVPLTILLRAAILTVVLLVPSRWALAQPGYVGIQIQPMTEEVAKAHRWKGTEGVFVREVYRNGPGETAGLQAGDIIVTFDGATVQGFNQVLALSRAKTEGEVAKLGILRNGQEKTVSLVYGKQPTADGGNGLRLDGYGMTLAPLSNDVKKRFSIVLDIPGVAVVSLDPGRPAAKAGLAVGDVIAVVGGVSVSDPARFQEAMKAAARDASGTVPLRVLREGTGRIVALTGHP